MMKIITVPDDLMIDGMGHSVCVYNYQSNRELEKQQIILTRNTISFLVEGAKEVFFNDSNRSIGASEFLMMRSGHCLMTEKLSEIESYKSILLFFTDKMLLDFIYAHKINIDFSKIGESVNCFRYDTFVRHFVHSLIAISRLPIAVRKKILEVKFQEIMLYLMGIYGTEIFASFLLNTNDTANRFRQVVENNQLRCLSLTELAFLCNMSVSTFKREFWNQYGVTPIKWFQNKRLEYAKYLLERGSKTVTEICGEIGYKSLSSFIYAYRMRYGVTPKQQQKN